MNRRFGVVSLIGPVLAIILLSGCNPPGQHDAESSVSNDDKTNAKPADDGKATVVDDGKKSVVPVVNTADKLPSVDTTKDAKTPSSLPVGLCPTLVDWKTLTDCVEKNHLQWYIDGVNQREKNTGFNWSDIKRWSKAKNADTVEVRAIEIFGKGISNAEARKRAAKLVGQDAAKNMAIIHQPACFDNTRGLEDGAMEDFVYCPPGSRQVRVSLLPAVVKDGEIVAILNTDAGVFIDCDNLWWIPDLIKIPGTPPQKNTPPTKQPPHKCVEIPGNGQIDCGPGKTGDFHGGGVPKGTVTGPGRDPVDVETSTPGGGGVVDTPTNDPGSETGGQAPGATEPSTGPIPTNPPEGDGTNDGSAGGAP